MSLFFQLLVSSFDYVGSILVMIALEFIYLEIGFLSLLYRPSDIEIIF